jgi:hypothetical protein
MNRTCKWQQGMFWELAQWWGVVFGPSIAGAISEGIYVAATQAPARTATGVAAVQTNPTIQNVVNNAGANMGRSGATYGWPARFGLCFPVYNSGLGRLRLTVIEREARSTPKIAHCQEPHKCELNFDPKLPSVR